MSIFFTVYRFELKKILTHKIVWIMMTSIIILLLGSIVTELFYNGISVDGEWISQYEYTMKRQEAAKKIEGRVLDEALYQEMKTAYAEIWKFEEALAYVDIYDLIKDVADGGVYGKEQIMTLTNMEDFYTQRWVHIEKMFEELGLSDMEKAYWEAKNDEISIPITYRFAQQPYEILESIYTLGILLLLIIAAGLPGVFCDEHRMRTDQLILCSRHGRGKLYFAKIAAGLTFCLASALIMAAVTAVPVLFFYGTRGFDAAVLIKMPYAVSDKSFGSILAGYFAIYLIAALVFGAFAMFFSELTRNGIAAMTVMVCGMLFCVTVNIPDRLRILAQAVALFPNALLAPWSLYDFRLIPFFGGYLTNLQAASLIYLLLTVLFIIWGRKRYNGYQAGGR